MGQGSAKLPKADMDFLLKNTCYTKETIKQWYKDIMKDNPYGKFNAEELKKVFKTLYPNGNAEAFSRLLISNFNTDRSGYVGFREFMLAISVMSKGKSKEKLEFAYAMADMDDNGVVQRRELRGILMAVARVKQDGDLDEVDKKAEEIFERLDLNKDGVISKDEFVQGCLGDASLCEMFAPTLEFDDWWHNNTACD